jgi:glycosyltransferase involved in cell wall biosynthesis
MIQGAAGSLAVVGPCFPFRGGIAHYSTMLVRNLRRRYRVEFVTFRRQYPQFLFPGKTQYDDSSSAIREANDPLIDSIGPGSWWRTARRLRQLNPDLIVMNWWHPFFGLAYGAVIQLLPRTLRARVCFLCHNVLPHERTLLDRALCAFAFHHVQRFIVHSEEDKQTLLGLKPDAHVRRNCHPVFAQFSEARALDKAAAREKLGLPLDGNLLLFFGLIRAYKGLNHLIAAMPAVLREVECGLLVAGEFYDDKAKYTGLVEQLGIRDRVRIEDKYIPNEDVHLYFEAADVVVLPYVEASQSGIVPIAYSFNTPVISTRVGGLPEAVLDGTTGFLVSASSSAELAQAIVRYYKGGHEPRLRAGIARHVEQFGCAEEIKNIELFRQAVGGAA